MMYGCGKSDEAIVAGKSANKAGAIRCGADGAKGRGQGKCGPAAHALDTVPECACHRRWLHAHHRHRGGAFGPEVGAVCGKAARTVLVQRG